MLYGAAVGREGWTKGVVLTDKYRSGGVVVSQPTFCRPMWSWAHDRIQLVMVRRSSSIRTGATSPGKERSDKYRSAKCASSSEGLIVSLIFT